MKAVKNRQNRPLVSTEKETEIVIGFVSAVGVDIKIAEDAAEHHLATLGYQVFRIHVTNDVLPLLDRRASQVFNDYYDRTTTLMDIGDEARESQKKVTRDIQYDVIAVGIASAISKLRAKSNTKNQKTAYLVHSLKHPHEVRRLREIYQRGFYLIGVHAPAETRRRYLIKDRELTRDKANLLMDRDKQEKEAHGQKLVDTFHLADFFVGWRLMKNKRDDAKYRKILCNNIGRFIEIIFGHPNKTPTFGEYAMFMAFSAALRSSDLSRQVGAVITREKEILGAGANDCPRPNGGLYWPVFDKKELAYIDTPGGRDHTKGHDSNQKELIRIKGLLLDDARAEFERVLQNAEATAQIVTGRSREILGKLTNALSHSVERSPITDLTEFGRVVHAEMEAILSCSRKGISTVGATLFSTTFPCHNCAKHIIAAGVDRVVFIEPYLKSKALDMFDGDAIEIAYPDLLKEKKEGRPEKVQFEPFVGVGPRRFVDLFSVGLGVGSPIKRKGIGGKVVEWVPEVARVRVEMTQDSYIEREMSAASAFEAIVSHGK